MIQNVYQSRDLLPKFLWHQHFYKLIDFDSNCIVPSSLPFRDLFVALIFLLETIHKVRTLKFGDFQTPLSPCTVLNNRMTS